MAKRENYGKDADLVTDDEAELVLGETEIEDEVTEDEGAGLDEGQIEAIVGTAVDEAIGFISDEIADRRIKAHKYFSGQVDIGEEPGRSKVVATKCRDTVRAVKPSIQRVFMSAERPVEFIPSGPEDVETMEQASVYAAAKFRQSNGFKILRDVTHDALVSITGFTKAYWSEYDRPKVYEFTDLDDAQYESLTGSEGLQILSEETRQDDAAIEIMRQDIEAAQQMAAQAQSMGQPVDPSQIPQMPEVLPQLHNVRALHSDPTGKLCIETVPPEEFFIDRNARSDEDFYVIGHRTEMRAADVIAMGIDEGKVASLGTVSSVDLRDQEEEQRRTYSVNRGEDESPQDPAMKLVTITEAYMRVDIEGTGTPILHKFLLGGGNNKLLSYEPVDDHPFAGWHVDPEPHTYFGRSLVELIEQDQDAATAITRGILDNVQMTNNPRVEVVKGQVNLDDLMNNEIGGIVRVEAPGMMRDIAVPFMAGQTLPALQYVDQMVEMKTGVTRASMGLDPDALQSTTRAAVTATVSAGAGQVEVMVSNLAYTGMKRLFCQVLKIMSKHSTKAEMMRVNGKYVSMDPRVWDAELDATVNVGLGTGREDQKSAMLGQLLQFQMQAIQTFGPANPMAGIEQLRNTWGDLLALNGIPNADRYFPPPQPPAPPAPEQAQPDPMQGLVAAEQIKAQAKLQSDGARMQLDLEKARMQDDRDRDRMAQELAIKQAEINGKYSIAIDTARIKAEQAATPVMPQQQPMNGGV